jgi:hypothetical protein
MGRHTAPAAVFVDESGRRAARVNLSVRVLLALLTLLLAGFGLSLVGGVPLAGLSDPVRLPSAERPQPNLSAAAPIAEARHSQPASSVAGPSDPAAPPLGRTTSLASAASRAALGTVARPAPAGRSTASRTTAPTTTAAVAATTPPGQARTTHGSPSRSVPPGKSHNTHTPSSSAGRTRTRAP